MRPHLPGFCLAAVLVLGWAHGWASPAEQPGRSEQLDQSPARTDGSRPASVALEDLRAQRLAVLEELAALEEGWAELDEGNDRSASELEERSGRLLGRLEELDRKINLASREKSRREASSRP